jgi:NAD(P)-dependent dehydrogenase (short-subunit alcohol dehydrogenase family)
VTYEVNVFGAIRTTQAFLALIKKSSAPRIVMMSSRLGSLA